MHTASRDESCTLLCYKVCAEEVGHIQILIRVYLPQAHATHARTRCVGKSNTIHDIAKIMTNLLWIVCMSQKHMA